MRVVIPLVLICLLIGTVDAQTFRAAAEVTAFTGSPASEYAASITADMLHMYWTSARTGGSGSRDVWTSSRKSLASPWTRPVNVAPLNSSVYEYYVTVRPDHLEIVFASTRTGGAGGNDLYSSTRAKVTDPWGTPVPLKVLNTSAYEDDPSFRGDGLELIFSSSRTGLSQKTGLWSTTRKDFNSPWSAPALIKELDTINDDHSPAISGDGLSLFFSIYNHPGGTGSSDFFVATRPDLNSPYGKFTEIKELNTTGWEHNGCQTADGFSFYYTPNSQNKIFRADRILSVCWPPNGNPQVGTTFEIYVRRDIGDTVGIIVGALATIPPTPIPPLVGNLEVNFGLMVWFASGMIDLEGKYTTKIPIDKNPILVGIDVYFQGAVQNKAGIYLSNLRKVTIE